MFNYLKTKFAMLFKNTRTDEIEKKISKIARSNLDKEEKRQKLFRLAKELGLPIHSSDVRSTALSYPEMFDRINDWIKNQRAENHTRRTVCASWISSITAMLAVIISLWIYWQTRQLLTPTERPIFSAVDSKCKGNVNNDTAELEITLNTIVKNVGKHPAENMKMRVWGAPLDEPNNLKMCREFTLADPFFPDIQVTLSNRITIKPKSFDRLKYQKKKVFLYIRMDYNDAFKAKMKYTQGFHLVYEIGKGFINGATLKEKEIFESSLKEIDAI